MAKATGEAQEVKGILANHVTVRVEISIKRNSESRPISFIKIAVKTKEGYSGVS